MGSPITFSGFNQIDFNLILNAVMQQESAPLTTLQTQQKSLQSRATTYGTLASKLSAFESALSNLKDATALLGRTTTVSDETSVRAASTSSAAPGAYEVVVQELARAQVMASGSFAPDADSTKVAWGGTLNIGGVDVTIAAPVTLQELAEQINSTRDIPVTATVVRSGASAYQLVLTGKATGAAGAFTVANALTGGSGVSFVDTDGNGVSGDSAEDNAVSASDAVALVNNVRVTSETNTLENVIAGVSLTLLKKDPAATTTVAVAEDLTATKDLLSKVVSTYNDLVTFAEDQANSAVKGDQSSIARDPLLRSLRFALRNAITQAYPAGGSVDSLAAIGLGLERTGKMSFDAARFDEIVSSQRDDVTSLLTGNGTDPGAFASIASLVESYTKSDGLLRDARERLDDQVAALTTRINDLTERLAVRRAALQKQYMAADMTMTQLTSSASSLASLGNQYRLF
jgi:flagellar hook-associated protein 2